MMAPLVRDGGTGRLETAVACVGDIAVLDAVRAEVVNDDSGVDVEAEDTEVVGVDEVAPDAASATRSC